MTKDELESDLKDLPDVREVSVVGNGTLIATVVSGSFSGQNEAERQEAVWKLLQNRRESQQLQNVEFIFTNAPGE
jgi:acid stress-induced BolA-like protein IbaG/YrbA